MTRFLFFLLQKLPFCYACSNEGLFTLKYLFPCLKVKLKYMFSMYLQKVLRQVMKDIILCIMSVRLQHKDVLC